MKKKFICPICGYVHEGEEAPERCPQCKQIVEWKVVDESAALNFVTEHVLGIAKGTGDDMITHQLLGGRSGLLDRSGRELGLCGLGVLELVGDVHIIALDAAAERSDDGNHEDKHYQTPGNLLEDIGGLTHNESLVAFNEIAGQALSLAILEKHYADEQEARQDDEHCKDCKYCVHILIL